MNKKLNFLLCILLLASTQTLLAAALPFANGNFDAGLAGWDVGGDAGLNVAQQVELSTLGGAFPAASLIQGDFLFGPNSIQLGATDNFLNFDVWYQDLGPGGASGSILSDGLVVSILDELDFTGASDLFFDSEFDFLMGAPFASVSVNISSLAGRSVGLFFDVFNEDDGRNSLFTLDNVSFTETNPNAIVPEPGILLLLLPGLMLFASRFKQNIK